MKRTTMICLLWLGISLPAAAQVLLEHSPQNFDLFGSDEPLKIELEFDIKQLIKQKYKDEYQPANIRIFFGDTAYIAREIRVKARGNLRRRVCFLPPLKLNFKKTTFGNPQMDQLKSLKMVSVCKPSKSYEQYVLQEYKIYKIYNLLTPMSFRVRLLDITFLDSRGKRKPQHNYGFIIEDIDDVAARNNCIELEQSRLHPHETNRQLAALVYVFQYMIGNTDFELSNLHNLKLIRSKDPLDYAPYIIPYDFDYSGLVNANYAVPHESLGIESVRERLYRGYCQPDSVMNRVFELFNEKKADIMGLYEHCPYLSKTNRVYSLRYLEDFYTIINSPFLVKREITDVCRN